MNVKNGAVFVFILLMGFAIGSEARSTHAEPWKGPSKEEINKKYEKIWNNTLEGKSNQEYFEEVNNGWMEVLSGLKNKLKKESSYIVLHVVEPKRVMDTRTAEDFKQSLTQDGLFNLSTDSVGIGHNFISWSCASPDGGKRTEGGTGMTGELDHQFQALLDRGWGLAAFKSYYSDGHLQTPKLLNLEYFEPLPIHTVAIEVERDECLRAANFVHEFITHPEDPRFYFGFELDPENFEGGGCGSFAYSIVQHAGFLEESGLLPLFWKDVQVKKSLFGYGMPVPSDDTFPFVLREGEVKKVNKVKLFLANWNPRRASDVESFFFHDPEAVLLFIKTVYRGGLSEIYQDNLRRARLLMKGPLYKRRILRIGPEFIPIDGKFQDRYGEIVDTTNHWVKKMRREKGYRMRTATVGTSFFPQIGVIFDTR